MQLLRHDDEMLDAVQLHGRRLYIAIPYYSNRNIELDNEPVKAFKIVQMGAEDAPGMTGCAR